MRNGTTMNPYIELAYDLGLLNCNLSAEAAQEVITFLEQKGLLDYDTLKEVYLDNDD